MKANEESEMESLMDMEGPIYYRYSEKGRFFGPFNESRVQRWYQQGFFHSGIEFKKGENGEVYRLDRLRELNGIACPFSFLVDTEKRRKLEEITADFHAVSTMVHQAVEIMKEEIENMRPLLERLEEKVEKATASQSGIDERVGQLEEYYVEFSERAEEWLESKQRENGRESNEKRRDVGEMDERLAEKMSKLEEQVIFLNQERVKMKKRLGQLERTSLSIPWVKKSAIDSDESLEDTKERLRREKEARELMWNSSQMLGHSPSLVDHGRSASKAQVKALERALKRSDEGTREEIARNWDGLVDFSNVKCFFCRCSLNNASDFMNHLSNGTHLSILPFCRVSSECLEFFVNKL